MLDNFTTNFNDFINQRFADNTEKLKKNKLYSKNENTFYKLEETILNKASKKHINSAFLTALILIII